MAGNMVGRTFNNRYKITERVGIGGMAEVYRAQDNVLGRMVAVKVMLPQYAADPTFTKRFRQEAASAANLQSPYIVNIYDWGLDDETYYIVMEFLRGTDLKTAIQERGVINQRKAAEIGSQVAQALSVAHEGGIIHRDIKPQNIMIQPDGNIKVMDFGIARAGDAGLSQTATVLGTAHYVSPEQAQGKELTGASDMYSLGVVLYEAVTGKLPFEGTDAVSVAVKQVQEIPAAPSTINPNVDPGLEAIIMKALEKDPSRRFTNMAEMRRYLNDFLAGRPINLGQDISGLTTQVINPVAGDGTKVMSAVAPVATEPTRAQRAYAAEPEKKSNGKKTGLIIGGIIAAIVVIAAIVFALSSGDDGVEVPDVSNQPVAEAEQALEDAGFTIGKEIEVYSSEVEAGNVVSTNPKAGEKAEKGAKINISVSKGTEEVAVPDLKGKSADDARKALSEAGLNASEGDTVYSDDVEEGKVAGQDTEAGSTANKGDTVVYHLSKGPEQVEVPNVVGLSASKAQSSLESNGFKYSLTYQDSDTVAEGNVISQSPNAGNSADKGATIKLVISNGSSEISVPNVVGSDQATATSTLQNAGFKVNTTTNTSATVPEGSVISQDVTGTAKKGSTITITISGGPGASAGDDTGAKTNN